MNLIEVLAGLWALEKLVTVLSAVAAAYLMLGVLIADYLESNNLHDFNPKTRTALGMFRAFATAPFILVYLSIFKRNSK